MRNSAISGLLNLKPAGELEAFEAFAFHVVVLSSRQHQVTFRSRAVNKYSSPGPLGLKHMAALSALKVVSFLIVLGDC